MPLYLSKNLAPLAALTAGGGSRVPAAVRVLGPGDGTYRCEATDGRRLAVVRGPCLIKDSPALADIPGGDTEVLVPAADWRSAFRLGGRAQPVGLACDGDRLTLAVGDQAVVGAVPGGRFPDTDAVLPKRPALLSIALDPALLAGLLKAAAALGPAGGVALLYYGPGRPVGLSGRNDQGQFFDALLMPLT